MVRRMLCPVTFSAVINLPIDINEGENAEHASAKAEAIVRALVTQARFILTGHGIDENTINCEPEQCTEIEV